MNKGSDKERPGCGIVPIFLQKNRHPVTRMSVLDPYVGKSQSCRRLMPSF